MEIVGLHVCWDTAEEHLKFSVASVSGAFLLLEAGSVCKCQHCGRRRRASARADAAAAHDDAEDAEEDALAVVLLQEEAEADLVEGFYEG